MFEPSGLSAMCNRKSGALTRGAPYLIISDAPRCTYRCETDKGLKGGAIHEPDYALASNGVLPKNVRLAVPVEVARTSDAPRCIYRSQIDKGLKRGAIHEPDYALASNGVLPKNVRLAVPVEVARTSDAPRGIYRSQIHKGLKR